jgi:peroxiredoxin
MNTKESTTTQRKVFLIKKDAKTEEVIVDKPVSEEPKVVAKVEVVKKRSSYLDNLSRL